MDQSTSQLTDNINQHNNLTTDNMDISDNNNLKREDPDQDTQLTDNINQLTDNMNQLTDSINQHNNLTTDNMGISDNNNLKREDPDQDTQLTDNMNQLTDNINQHNNLTTDNMGISDNNNLKREDNDQTKFNEKSQLNTNSDHENLAQRHTSFSQTTSRSQALTGIQNIFSETEKIAYISLCYLAILGRDKARLGSGLESHQEWSDVLMNKLFIYLNISNDG
jgi:X-X-X-Leu-X-X-Gly heptad repeat protein